MRLVIAALGGLLLCASGAYAAEGAPAADETSVQAKRMYERGMAHFQLAEYDDAIAKWQEGFRLKPVPEFLYNIGQAYRLSSRPDKAVQNYRAYLRMAPDAKNRVEVEHHIAALQKVIDQTRSAATAPPVQPNEPSGMGHNEPAPTVQPVAPPPATVAVTPAPASNGLVATAPERKTPLTKKGWFWGVVAGGAVVVAGAVVLGVVLGTKDNAKVLQPLSY